MCLLYATAVRFREDRINRILESRAILTSCATEQLLALYPVLFIHPYRHWLQRALVAKLGL